MNGEGTPPDNSSPAPRPRVAILIVNGFSRELRWSQQNLALALRYPWIDLCLRQVARHSQGWDYELFIYDNSHLRQHREHMREYQNVHVLPRDWFAAVGRTASRVPHRVARRALERALERRHPQALDYMARKVPSHFDYIVTLDNDSFPVRGDWLDVLVSECERGAALAGVHRDEMAPTVAPFIHVSGLCIRRADLLELGVSFGRDMRQDEGYNQDVGQRITYELIARGRTIAPLQRSNEVNFHFLAGGIYGDVIYHQGAGSRRVSFWTSTDHDDDERIASVLRDAAFADLDHLLAVLRGQAENDLGLNPIVLGEPPTYAS